MGKRNNRGTEVETKHRMRKRWNELGEKEEELVQEKPEIHRWKRLKDTKLDQWFNRQRNPGE